MERETMVGLPAMPAGTNDSDIERINRDYCVAYNAGDIEKVLAFLAEDAMTLSPDQAPVRGREAHRRYIEAGFAREPQRRLSLTSLRSGRAGELLYDAGEWTNTVGAAGAPAARTSSGFYMTIYRREHGAWKVVMTTFNVSG